MSPSQLHAAFKRKYKNEGNLLNVKRDDRKLETDGTQNYKYEIRSHLNQGLPDSEMKQHFT